MFNNINNKKKILVIDDDEIFLKQFKLLLETFHFNVTTISNPHKVINLLQKSDFDCIILDVNMPSIDGITLLKKIYPKSLETPIIMLSQEPKIQNAVKALKLGAVDFVEKLDDPENIVNTIQKTIEHVELQKLKTVVTQIKDELKSSFQIISHSPAMNNVLKLIEKAANSDIPVLLVGETGVGKTYIAEAIHAKSKRSIYKFVDISMANMSPHLVESELFGYEKGAFTGAMKRKDGLLKIANKGTIFLDEIAEMPVELQPKLNQFLDTHTFIPLGSTTEVKVDVRVISATNKPLDELKSGKGFRTDLFYRLGGIIIYIPPLRERREDIWPLVKFFFEKHRKLRPDIVGFHPLTQVLFEHYSWPGNVRELENFVQRLLILTDGNVITKEIVQHEFNNILKNNHHNSFNNNLLMNLKTAREEFERDYIYFVLKSTNFNKTKAAQILGIDRVHLQRKIKQLGIQHPE